MCSPRLYCDRESHETGVTNVVKHFGWMKNFVFGKKQDLKESPTQVFEYRCYKRLSKTFYTFHLFKILFKTHCAWVFK